MLVSRKCVNENVEIYLGVQVLISLHIYMVFAITWSLNQYPIWCRPLILINTCHWCGQINDPHICCSRFKNHELCRAVLYLSGGILGNYTKKTPWSQSSEKASSTTIYAAWIKYIAISVFEKLIHVAKLSQTSFMSWIVFMILLDF